MDKSSAQNLGCRYSKQVVEDLKKIWFEFLYLIHELPEGNDISLVIHDMWNLVIHDM